MASFSFIVLPEMVTESTLLLVGLGDFNISLETFNRLCHNSCFKYALLALLCSGLGGLC